MNPFSLLDKVILVTGASSGIGRQIAISAAAAGAKIICLGRSKEKLQRTMEQLQGSGHALIAADLTQSEELKDILEDIPKLNGLVHSAGMTAYMPANFIGKKHIDEVFSINFEAVVVFTSALLKAKKIENKASILFLSSIATKHAYFAGGMYAASKSAIEAYSANLALELAPKGIRSNCLAPTFVKTEMVEKSEQTISPESMEKMKKMHPLGFGEVEDVAHTAVFFLSDASRWISATVLPMGGI
jgi:NAD(P)-dependent dehydrogenase (short-subunit alcohol dehydrogenase family)